jgi:3-dehydroquinate synthase
MRSVHVNLAQRSYAIEFGSFAQFPAYLRRLFPKSQSVFLAYDSSVKCHSAPLFSSLKAEGFTPESYKIPSGEASKSFTQTQQLYDALAAMPADRSTPVIALGGGVTGDLAGFAAATYNRGLPLVMIPTTLLSMVDSSVGGKVGINHTAGKNLIGAFHQPKGVFIATELLATLPEREYRSGLAEVVKYGVILDPEFFAFLEANIPAILARETLVIETIVARSCQLKADVVQLDEFETTGIRAKLNYGHTFAHAYETVGGYGAWLHGEAVAAGMIAASRLAEKLGRISPEITERQHRLLTAFHLPTSPKPDWPVEDLLAVMRRDKKAVGGKLRFILPTKLGHVELVGDVPEDLVREVLAS